MLRIPQLDVVRHVELRAGCEDSLNDGTIDRVVQSHARARRTDHLEPPVPIGLLPSSSDWAVTAALVLL